MIHIPIWLICIYIIFVIFTAIIGFGTGYKLADRAWMQLYIDLTRREGEIDIL